MKFKILPLKIHSEMQRRGIKKQQELQKACKLNQRTMTKVMSGEGVSLQTAIKICDGLTSFGKEQVIIDTIFTICK